MVTGALEAQSIRAGSKGGILPNPVMSATVASGRDLYLPALFCICWICKAST